MAKTCIKFQFSYTTNVYISFPVFHSIIAQFALISLHSVCPQKQFHTCRHIISAKPAGGTLKWVCTLMLTSRYGVVIWSAGDICWRRGAHRRLVVVLQCIAVNAIKIKKYCNIWSETRRYYTATQGKVTYLNSNRKPQFEQLENKAFFHE